MSLSKTLYPLLSTGSTQEDPSQHNLKKVLTVKYKTKNGNKQTNPTAADNQFCNVYLDFHEI